MPYLQLTPVFAVLFGILLWGDRPGWRLYLGGAAVMLGILIITLRARKKSIAGGKTMKDASQTSDIM